MKIQSALEQNSVCKTRKSDKKTENNELQICSKKYRVNFAEIQSNLQRKFKPNYKRELQGSSERISGKFRVYLGKSIANVRAVIRDSGKLRVIF